MSNFLYVSSNNQLLCLAYNVLTRAGIPVPEKGWVLDNGAVLRLRGSASGCEVRMIHPEKVSNPDRFVSLEDFNAVMATSSHAHLAIPAGSTIYLVRHGHALHNEPSTPLQDARDADLTPTGIIQAHDAGRVVAADAAQHSAGAFSVHCSDLVRTMHTCAIILQHFPPHTRPATCSVCLEARENTRPIGGVHHWQADNPLRRVAIDPFLSLEELRALAPGKSDAEVERLRAENLPRNDPVGAWEQCIKSTGELGLDWSDYIAKVQRARADGKTFGDAASETLFLDIVLRNAQ
jgi:broad specificity phosphatase PhoE